MPLVVDLLADPVAPPVTVTSLDGQLTATLDADHAGAFFELDANDAAAHHFRLYRRDPGELVSVVRGADPALAPGGFGVAYDHEAPLGAATSWWAVIYDVHGAVLDTTEEVSFAITPPTGVADVWLKSINQPSLSRLVIVSEWSESSYASSGTLTQIIGNPLPAARLGVMNGSTTTLSVLTQSFAQRDAIERLLHVGRYLAPTAPTVLLIQTAASNGQHDKFFVVTGIAVERFGSAKQPERLFTLDLTQVARPVTTDSRMLTPSGSYADLTDPSWTDAGARVPRYADFFAEE